MSTLDLKQFPQKRFSNVQLALLELFTEDVPEEDLLEIKKMLSSYRFKLATEAADEVAREKGWTEEDFDRMLHKHVRKPYKESSSKPAE
ncbi:MAG: hypothetical protein EPGJADBJ_04593 [Saprospiraceae bacterium]|nr:hypothetical protein [Saprospiraceae bacterium]